MRGGRVFALSLGLALAWPAAPALAAAPPSAGKAKKGKQRRKRRRDPSQPDPDIIEQARVLSDEAFLRFDSRDFARAVELWREAQRVLPLEPLYAAHRRHFDIQIAYAYKRSYTFSGEPSELAAAREQFEVYRASLPAEDLASRELITRELEDIEALEQAAEREALARRQQAYDDYLAVYARPHGGYSVYRNRFAIGRDPEPAQVLSAYALLVHMGEPKLAKKHRHLRRTSLAGWGLSGAGFLVTFFSLPFVLAFDSGSARGVAGAGGAVLATGLGLGFGGMIGLRRLDVEGVIDGYNASLAREHGLLELRPSASLPPRLRRFEQATGFRMGITVQGLQL